MSYSDPEDRANLKEIISRDFDDKTIGKLIQRLKNNPSASLKGGGSNVVTEYFEVLQEVAVERSILPQNTVVDLASLRKKPNVPKSPN